MLGELKGAEKYKQQGQHPGLRVEVMNVFSSEYRIPVLDFDSNASSFRALINSLLDDSNFNKKHESEKIMLVG